MAKFKRKHKRQENRPHTGKICDPAICHHCIYLGEGDFICDELTDPADGGPVMVMSDWEPTEHYAGCNNGS